MSVTDDLGQGLAAQAKAAAGSNKTVSDLADGVDTGAQVLSRYNSLSKYKPKRFPKSLKEGAQWGEQTLVAYAKDNGKQWAIEGIRKVASAYGYDGYIPDEIPTNEKEMADTLVDVASVAAGDELGVNPKLIKVTAETLMDGKLDKKDGEAIGSLAGSIAGAALCQTFGIPAPIGAFLGGELGGFIGGEIADIFGASKRAHREWLDKQRKIVADIRQKAEDQCMQIRNGYWQSFDAYVRQAELTWEDLEIKAGYRFDLRWFDRSPTPQFLQFLQQQQSRYANRISGQTCDLVCPDGSVLKTGSAKPYLPSDQINSYAAQCRTLIQQRIAQKYHVTLSAASIVAGGDTSPHDVCGINCLAEYGCLYPDMTPYTQFPQVPGTLTSPKRVCAAYYALGFPWLPPITPELMRSWGAHDWTTLMAAFQAHAGQYRPNFCDLPEASQRAVEDESYRPLWIDWLNKMLALEQQKVAALNSASVRIFGDLTQTAAMVAVQRKIGDAKTRASLKGLGTTDAAITSSSSWINNGMLVAGLGWLAYNSRR